MAETNISSFMSAESLQVFTATLAGLGADEISKAKELYIRNAIAEYHTEQRNHKNNYFTMAFHLLIPIFWPMLLGSQRENKIRIQEKKTKILNAMQVWKDDLRHCYSELQTQLENKPA